MFQVPCSNKDLIFPAILFTDNQWQEAVFAKRIKSGDKKLTAEKWNLLADYRGNVVSNLFKSIFRYKCTMIQGTFQSGLWKSELQRF